MVAPPQQRTRPTARRALATLASLAISAAVLAAVARHEAVSAAQVRAAWAGAAPGWLALTAVVSVVMFVGLAADKLRRVVGAAGGAVGLGEATRIRLGSGPLRFLTPGRAAGLLNILYLARYCGVSPPRAAGALSFDRGLNLAGTLIWLLAGLALLGRGGGALALSLAALAAVLVAFFATGLHRLAARQAARLSPRLGAATAELLAPFEAFPAGPKAGLLLYGVVYQAGPFVVCALLFQALGHPIQLGEAMAFISLANLAGQVPGPLMGVGPREAALVALFGDRVPAEVALAAGLGVSLFVQGAPTLAGLPWVPWYLQRLAGPQATPAAPAVE
jgi:uncharacterized membrane protein YbhN (UPF0104 family)